MTLQPGAMTDYELRREIEHHRGLIADLSPEASARKSLQAALNAYLGECKERVELRSVNQAQVLAEYSDGAA
jgi:signal transduction histidine kinase